jgi:hypothetical protein
MQLTEKKKKKAVAVRTHRQGVHPFATESNCLER